MTEVLTQAERARRAELNADLRTALGLGISIDEFHVARQETVSRWCEWLRAEMARARTDDPVEILPAALTRAQQLAVCEARRAAENLARAEVQQHCIKEARRIAQETARDEIRSLLQKAIVDGDQRS